MNQNIIDREHPYCEADWVAAMAREREIPFAREGKLLFPVVVYPDALDAVALDGDGHYPKRDRYRMELMHSARFLVQVLLRMTGDRAVLLPQSAYPGGPAIILSVDPAAAVSTQGYRTIVCRTGITITSVGEQGVSNGIYAFLEELGCMFLTEDCDYIPPLPTIYLERKNQVSEPDVLWRSVYAYGAEKPEEGANHRDYFGWHTKLRLNGAGSDDWGTWCHSSFQFIPPAEYYAEHPEYFSLYHGRRVYQQGPVSGQLCWTNEEVYQIVSRKLFQMMADNPDVHIWDVSQMDTWINRGVGCRCPKCRELDRREGTPMGSLLTFINRLADECAARFPENYISTLAYNYTEKPPRHLRPRENVIIKLCLMPGDVSSNYAHPTSRWSRRAHRTVAQWGQIAPHLLIWDYNVDYHSYLMPFPVLPSMRPNNAFYLENHVYGIFHQMAREKGAAHAAFHTYLFSHLMWDRTVDPGRIAGKYLDVYFRQAAPYIAAYYQALADQVRRCGQPLYLYAQPWRYRFGYLSPRCQREYWELLERAREAAAGDSELTARVEREMLGLLYIRACTFSLDRAARRDALESMVRICRANGITTWVEGRRDMLDSFYQSTLKAINGNPVPELIKAAGHGAAAAFIRLYNKICR